MARLVPQTGAQAYGLGEQYIPAPIYTPQYGEIMVAS
jgi:hypothetical protein